MKPHWKNKTLENISEVIDGVGYVEEWRDVKGYEDIYMISNFGRLKSLSRNMKVCGVWRFSIMNRILSQSVNYKGYLSVSLHKNGATKSTVAHILVGVAFIPNPNNLPEINHLKGIKTDNRSHQLEWSTHKDNCQHAFRTGIATISEKCKQSVADKNRLYTGEKHHMSKLVVNTETGIFYYSVREAADSINMVTSTLYTKLNKIGHSPNNTSFIYA